MTSFTVCETIRPCLTLGNFRASTMAEMATKQVHIHYFALLREERGISVETVETSARTLRQLYEELKDKHGFRLPCERLRVAVNDELQNWEDGLSDEDRIILIPPVAGG